MDANTVLQEIGPPENVSVSFGIRSTNLRPDEITAALEIQPSWSFAKGDVYQGAIYDPHTKSVIPKTKIRGTGVWGLRSKDVVGFATLDRHIEYILGMLEPRKDIIRRWVENPEYYVCIRASWYTVSGQGDLGFSSDQLKRISELCQGLVVGCVVSDPDDEDTTTTEMEEHSH